MWTVNGCPFGCQDCPLLLIHDVPVAPFFVACVLPLRLAGDLAFDLFGSCLVCVICALVGEQRRARRELRIQMDEGFWAGGIRLLSVSVSRAGVCQVHEEVGSSSNSSSRPSRRHRRRRCVCCGCRSRCGCGAAHPPFYHLAPPSADAAA